MEDTRLQKIFNEAFADEANLVRETFRAEMENEEQPLVSASPKNRPLPAAPPPPIAVNELWAERPKVAPVLAPRVPAAPVRAVRAPIAPAQPAAPAQNTSDLWGAVAPSPLPPAPTPRVSRVPLETRIRVEEESRHAQPQTSVPGHQTSLPLQMDENLTRNLSEIVDKALNRILPPIVERMVQERLDKLLKDH
jgi:hypothetical protein